MRGVRMSRMSAQQRAQEQRRLLRKCRLIAAALALVATGVAALPLLFRSACGANPELVGIGSGGVLALLWLGVYLVLPLAVLPDKYAHAHNRCLDVLTFRGWRTIDLRRLAAIDTRSMAGPQAGSTYCTVRDQFGGHVFLCWRPFDPVERFQRRLRAAAREQPEVLRSNRARRALGFFEAGLPRSFDVDAAAVGVAVLAWAGVGVVLTAYLSLAL
jgi:hypothetical protein